MTCQPSSLINSIHRNLPYFTNNPFEGQNLTNATFTVDNIIQDVEVSICINIVTYNYVYDWLTGHNTWQPTLFPFSVQEPGQVSS